MEQLAEYVKKQGGTVRLEYDSAPPSWRSGKGPDQWRWRLSAFSATTTCTSKPKGSGELDRAALRLLEKLDQAGV